MHTTADGFRNTARDAVAKADEAIAEFLLEAFARRCSGHDEYREGYEQDVRTASMKMQEIRDLIGG